mmetsp:Transcript_57651/g.151729  ORF Transcript_57651/g.151729 Transcript_57651/m.151729 type:complete len:200 (-) Transcript_57651:171-770(-)
MLQADRLGPAAQSLLVCQAVPQRLPDRLRPRAVGGERGLARPGRQDGVPGLCHSVQLSPVPHAARVGLAQLHLESSGDRDENAPDCAAAQVPELQRRFSASGAARPAHRSRGAGLEERRGGRLHEGHYAPAGGRRLPCHAVLPRRLSLVLRLQFLLERLRALPSVSAAAACPGPRAIFHHGEAPQGKVQQAGRCRQPDF